jgi:hypothetical protein
LRLGLQIPVIAGIDLNKLTICGLKMSRLTPIYWGDLVKRQRQQGFEYRNI